MRMALRGSRPPSAIDPKFANGLLLVLLLLTSVTACSSNHPSPGRSPSGNVPGVVKEGTPRRSLIEVSPNVARPGATLQLRFSGDLVLGRSAFFVLRKQPAGEFVAGLWSDQMESGPGYVLDESDFVILDVAPFSGPGPDRLVLPGIVGRGDYLLCTPRGTTSCATIKIR